MGAFNAGLKTCCNKDSFVPNSLYTSTHTWALQACRVALDPSFVETQKTANTQFERLPSSQAAPDVIDIPATSGMALHAAYFNKRHLVSPLAPCVTGFHSLEYLQEEGKVIHIDSYSLCSCLRRVRETLLAGSSPAIIRQEKKFLLTRGNRFFVRPPRDTEEFPPAG